MKPSKLERYKESLIKNVYLNDEIDYNSSIACYALSIFALNGTGKLSASFYVKFIKDVDSGKYGNPLTIKKVVDKIVSEVNK